MVNFMLRWSWIQFDSFGHTYGWPFQLDQITFYLKIQDHIFCTMLFHPCLLFDAWKMKRKGVWVKLKVKVHCPLDWMTIFVVNENRTMCPEYGASATWIGSSRGTRGPGPLHLSLGNLVEYKLYHWSMIL